MARRWRARLDLVPAWRLPKHWAPITTAVVCLLRLILPGGAIQIDHEVDLETVRAMKHGAGFWTAMDQGLRHVYGPASTIRAFRLPTVFVVWRVLPDWSWWPLFVVLAAVCGWLAGRLSGRDWTMPAVAALLVAYGKGPGYTQFLLVEPWAVPAILGCLLAYRRQRWVLAAALALVAAIVREQAALLLVVGLVISLARRQPWRAWGAWLAGLVAWGAFFAVHVAQVSPLLVAHGRETKLIGSSDALSVLRMAGFGLPLYVVAAPVLYVVAARRLRSVAMGPMLGGYLALPLAGIVVNRPYWGMLTVPVLITAAGITPDAGSTDKDSEEPVSDPDATGQALGGYR